MQDKIDKAIELKARQSVLRMNTQGWDIQAGNIAEYVQG